MLHVLSSTRLVVRSIGRIELLELGDLVWVVAAGNYVELCLGQRLVLHREPLRALAARLDPNTFVRIHRSTIVRCASVREVRASGHGDSLAVLGDRSFRISRRYRSALARIV